MTNAIREIPELHALDAREQLLRIPAEQDVPLTDRVRSIIDSPPFRRLSRISQLGLVQLVYPGATHSRFEHSLGAYRMCLHFLRRLSHDEQFIRAVTPKEIEQLIVASLLHDVGHWPFCHAIEDMNLDLIPEHEELAATWLTESEIATILSEQWSLDTSEVVTLLRAGGSSQSSMICQSILSSPIDVDKMDYLYRDSLHAGVPYGMNYDRQRLIGSLCLDENGSRLALTEKGSTAAELMVFARYVMFSEVYWHHTVRSATAMLQRMFFRVYRDVDLGALFRSTDNEFAQLIGPAAEACGASDLFNGIFGTKRRIYKRVAQFNYLEHNTIFDRLANQPYDALVDCSAMLAERLSVVARAPVSADEVLIDAPPVGLEVQFLIPIKDLRSKRFRQLGDVSPVVKTLATHQFDKFVKRVRVFVHPGLIDRVKQVANLDDLLRQVLEDAGLER